MAIHQIAVEIFKLKPQPLISWWLFGKGLGNMNMGMYKPNVTAINQIANWDLRIQTTTINPTVAFKVTRIHPLGNTNAWAKFHRQSIKSIKRELHAQGRIKSHLKIIKWRRRQRQLQRRRQRRQPPYQCRKLKLELAGSCPPPSPAHFVTELSRWNDLEKSFWMFPETRGSISRI